MRLEQAKKELSIAIAGKGAFGRFNLVLDSYPEVRGWWFGFKGRLLFDKALDWIIWELGEKNVNGRYNKKAS